MEKKKLRRRRRRKGRGPTYIHSRRHQDPLAYTVDAPIRIPSPHHAGEQVVTNAIHNLGQRVGAQRHDGQQVRPTPQLNVQNAGAAAPHALGLANGRTAAPLVVVEVDAVHARDGEQGLEGGLFGGLAGEEVGGGGGQDQADGEGRNAVVVVAGLVVRLQEGLDDVWDLDGGDGARRGEQEVGFAIVAGGAQVCEGVVGLPVGKASSAGCGHCYQCQLYVLKLRTRLAISIVFGLPSE